MLSDERKFGWVYVPQIQLYLHPTAYDVYQRVRAELSDGLSHGPVSRYGYKRGCRGPLCMKAQRDYGRRYQRKRYAAVRNNPTHKQIHDPLLDLFRPKELVK